MTVILLLPVKCSQIFKDCAIQIAELFMVVKNRFKFLAEYTKECAESAKEQLFGQPNAEDRAAEKVRDAADWTADKVGEARERVNEDDHTFMESVKEKFQDAGRLT